MIGVKSDLKSIFAAQSAFQDVVTSHKTPIDDVNWFAYHMNAMQEELGELLKADKRWKTHRNAHYDKENKLEELADVFITVVNLALFSGFTDDQLRSKVLDKIAENGIKLIKARGGQDDSNC